MYRVPFAGRNFEMHTGIHGPISPNMLLYFISIY